MRSVHIVYVAEEGVAMLTCGVGMVARNFLHAFPSIALQLKNMGIDAKLSVISIRAPKNEIGRAVKDIQKTRSICRQFHGELYLLQNRLSDTKNGYFDFARWRVYNTQANEIIRRISKEESSLVLAIANDGIFGQLTSLAISNVVIVWVPHSLHTIHKQSYVAKHDREKWENYVFQLIRKNPHVYIAAVSPAVSRFISNRRELPLRKIVPLYNGFFFPLFGRFFTISNGEIHAFLRRRKIPLHRDILLTFARADEYKGLDIALESMARIQRANGNRYISICIASKFSNEGIINHVNNRLLRIREKYRDQKIFIFNKYEFLLPKILLRYNRTKYLFHMPTRDFSPIIPFEASVLGHHRLRIMNSKIDCFKGIIIHRQNGFVCKPKVSAVVKTFNDIERLSPQDIAHILTAGRQYARKNFNIIPNYVHGIRTVLNRHHNGK